MTAHLRSCGWCAAHCYMATPAQVVSDANLNCVKEFFHQLTASLHPKVCVFHIQDRRQTELKRVSPRTALSKCARCGISSPHARCRLLAHFSRGPLMNMQQRAGTSQGKGTSLFWDFKGAAVETCFLTKC